MVTILLNYPSASTPYLLPSADTDRFWGSNVVLFEQAVAAASNAAIPFDPGVWTDLVLQGDWTGSLQYKIDSAGTVSFRGSPLNNVSATQTIATVPDGSRIPTGAFYSMVFGVDGQVGSILVQDDGTLTPYFVPSGSGASGGVYLANVIYSTVT